MASKSRASIRAWTCERISNGKLRCEFGADEQVDEGCRVSGVPGSSGDFDLARDARRIDGESDRVRGALDRGLDDAVPDYHSVHHAAAEDRKDAATDPVPEDAGAFCFFLRLPALFELGRARPIFQSCGYVGGRREEKVHYRRFRGICSADSAGGDVYEGMDSATGREKVAMAAPRNLYQRNSRRNSLCVAGEVG